MTNKTLKNSPWTISIVTTIFGVMLTMFFDYLKKEPILTTVWVILKWIEKIIWTILNYDLKVWWVILAISLFFIALKFINTFKKEETNKPDFCNYREDILKGWKWSWSWEFNISKNAWVITNLKAHCPKCDTPMIENRFFHKLEYTCPRCDFTTNYDTPCEEPYKIEIIIHDNIDRDRDRKESNI